MADTTNSQTASKPGAFNPLNPFNMQNPFEVAGLSGITEMWQKAAADQQARFASFIDEAAKLEEKSIADARRAIEEMSRLSLASIEYTRELSANLRKVAIETSKRISETPAAPAAGAEKTKKV